METQVGAQFANKSHQTTIDLQAEIIANQQKEIDRLNVLAVDNAAEIVRLKETVKWYQGNAGKLMGAVARAEIDAAPADADGDEITLLKRQIDNLKRHIAEYCPAPAAPSEQAERLTALLHDRRKAIVEMDAAAQKAIESKIIAHVVVCACSTEVAAPAAPLPAQPEQSAFLQAAKDFTQAHIDCDEFERAYEEDPNTGSDEESIDLNAVYTFTKQRLVEAYRAINSTDALAGTEPLPELTGPSAQKIDFDSLRRTIHELRTYNPAADECKGAHIHRAWADYIEAAICEAALIDAIAQFDAASTSPAPAQQHEPSAELPAECRNPIQITINGRQLRDALEAAWTERSNPDEGDTELTIFVREKDEISVEGEAMERGLWFYWTDYPEEGVCYLDPSAPETVISESAETAAPGAGTEDKQ